MTKLIKLGGYFKRHQIEQQSESVSFVRYNTNNHHFLYNIN